MTVRHLRAANKFAPCATLSKVDPASTGRPRSANLPILLARQDLLQPLLLHHECCLCRTPHAASLAAFLPRSCLDWAASVAALLPRSCLDRPPRFAAGLAASLAALLPRSCLDWPPRFAALLPRSCLDRPPRFAAGLAAGLAALLPRSCLDWPPCFAAFTQPTLPTTRATPANAERTFVTTPFETRHCKSMAEARRYTPNHKRLRKYSWTGLLLLAFACFARSCFPG